MKVAILHDYFAKKGGGERLVLGLAKGLKADIYTGFVDRANTFEEINQYNVTEIGRPMPAGLQTVYLMRKFKQLQLSGYGLYIFSGTMCITAAEHLKPNLLYCHTPPRFMYDLYDWFMQNTPFLQRMLLKALIWYCKPKDQHYMRQFDKIMVNSDHVKKRLLDYYGKEVHDKDDVVYSLIDLAKFKYKKDGDFYLSYGRLDPLKRVDVIVRAFQQMPNKKLIVCSGGPSLAEIKELAKGYANIDVKGYVSDKELTDLLGSCIATIYLPINEDMGLTPIESNAAGKPCIAANEGGPKELVKEGKTGLLIEASEENLIKAVKKLTPAKAKSMRKDCEAWGKTFSEKAFVDKVKKVIKSMGLHIT